jgi:hypothetical protein
VKADINPILSFFNSTSYSRLSFDEITLRSSLVTFSVTARRLSFHVEAISEVVPRWHRRSAVSMVLAVRREVLGLLREQAQLGNSGNDAEREVRVSRHLRD